MLLCIFNAEICASLEAKETKLDADRVCMFTNSQHAHKTQ